MALYGLLAILVAAVLFLAAAYLLPAGEQIAPPIRDEPIWDLPDGKRLDQDDVASVRLPVALRGYRFAETDLLLDRLAEELQSRDEEIARLRAGGATDTPDEHEVPDEHDLPDEHDVPHERDSPAKDSSESPEPAAAENEPAE